VTKNALQSIKPIKRENLLIKIGLKLRESIRMVDEVARYENQYLLVLPHTPLEGSKIADKRIKKTIFQILEEDKCELDNSEAVYSITVAYPENKENMDKLLEALRSSAIVSTA
jgi:PleD family two-component response regulator